MKATKEQRDAFRSNAVPPGLNGQNQYMPSRFETFVSALLDDLDEAERERDHERSIVGLLTVANERKDAALAVVQQLMDREGSCGEAGCTSIPTCEIKRHWAALAPAAPSASEKVPLILTSEEDAKIWANIERASACHAVFLVRTTCCGRDDGLHTFRTWGEADAFREAYISGPGVGIGGHQRTAIIVSPPAASRAALAPAAPSASEPKTNMRALAARAAEANAKRNAELDAMAPDEREKAIAEWASKLAADSVAVGEQDADAFVSPGSPSGDDAGQPSAERVAREWVDDRMLILGPHRGHYIDALADLILERERSAAARGELRGWNEAVEACASLVEAEPHPLNTHGRNLNDQRVERIRAMARPAAPTTGPAKEKLDE